MNGLRRCLAGLFSIGNENFQWIITDGARDGRGKSKSFHRKNSSVPESRSVDGTDGGRSPVFRPLPLRRLIRVVNKIRIEAEESLLCRYKDKIQVKYSSKVCVVAKVGHWTTYRPRSRPPPSSIYITSVTPGAPAAPEYPGPTRTDSSG